MKVIIKATTTIIQPEVKTPRVSKKRATKKAVRATKAAHKMKRVEFIPEMIRKVIDDRTPRQKHEAMIQDHRERKIARRENHRRNRFARSIIPITLL